jgi:TonB family protein
MARGSFWSGRNRFGAALAASVLLHGAGLSIWALVAPSMPVPGCILAEERLELVRLVTEQCICPDPSHPRADCPTLTEHAIASKPIATEPMRAKPPAAEPRKGAGGDVESAGGYRILTAEDGSGAPTIPSGGGGAGVGSGTGTGVGPRTQAGSPEGKDDGVAPAGDRRRDKPPDTAPRDITEPAEKKPDKPAAPDRAGKPEGASDDALRRYRDLVAAKLDANKVYPALSQQRGEEGVVVIRFSIGLDGMPSDVVVRESSRNRRLDKGARDTVARAAPYTPLPRGVDKPIPITVRLTFSLH